MFLQDIRSEVLTGEERGFKLSFHFRANPFFSETVRSWLSACSYSYPGGVIL